MIEDQVCVIHIENGIRQIPLEDEEGEGARARDGASLGRRGRYSVYTRIFQHTGTVIPRYSGLVKSGVLVSQGALVSYNVAIGCNRNGRITRVNLAAVGKHLLGLIVYGQGQAAVLVAERQQGVAEMELSLMVAGQLKGNVIDGGLGKGQCVASARCAALGNRVPSHKVGSSDRITCILRCQSDFVAISPRLVSHGHGGSVTIRVIGAIGRVNGSGHTAASIHRNDIKMLDDFSRIVAHAGDGHEAGAYLFVVTVVDGVISVLLQKYAFVVHGNGIIESDSFARVRIAFGNARDHVFFDGFGLYRNCLRSRGRFVTIGLDLEVNRQVARIGDGGGFIQIIAGPVIIAVHDRVLRGAVYSNLATMGGAVILH